MRLRVQPKNSADIVSSTKQEVSQLSSRMAVFQRNSSRSVYEIMDISNYIFSNLAKIDHVIFKNNVYAFLFGQANDFKPVDHHNCRLGKWYDGESVKSSSVISNRTAVLEAPHAAVHSQANALIADCGEGKKLCSRSQIEQRIKTIEEASHGVFEALRCFGRRENEDLMGSAINQLFGGTK
jgi:hypothetical protein